MNRIFFWLVVIAFACAAARELLVTIPWPETGWGAQFSAWSDLVGLDKGADGGAVSPMESLNNTIFDSAKKAVELAFKFVGGMALFLGLMKAVENGGGLKIAAKVIRPLMVRLFPDVPPSHPAMGAMIMNLSANALGLGNAATPFGVRAMQELDKLNPHKGTATNAMALFLTINTSSVTLLATGVAVIRREMGSQDPAGIIGTTLFATVCSTVVAILVCKWVERYFPPPAATNPIDATATDDSALESYPLWVSIAALLGVGVFIAVAIPFGETLSRWLIPLLVVGFLSFGALRGVAVYESLVEGAKDGFNTAVRIIPFLVAILVAVGMFTSSGALEAFTSVVGPWTAHVGLPAEALPMALVRPLSGSGASGVMMATMANPATGPDTYTGYLVSTIQGSSETTFYVLAVYYGAIQVKATRHTLIPALTAELFGVIGSILAVSAYWNWVALG